MDQLQAGVSVRGPGGYIQKEFHEVRPGFQGVDSEPSGGEVQGEGIVGNGIGRETVVPGEDSGSCRRISQGDGDVPVELVVVVKGLLCHQPLGGGGVPLQGLGSDGDLVPVMVEGKGRHGHYAQDED